MWARAELKYHGRTVTQVQALAQKLQHLKTKRVNLALGLTGGPGIGKSFTARVALQTAKLEHLIISANASNSALARAWLEYLDDRTKKRVPAWALGFLERLKRNEVVPSEGVAQAIITMMQQLMPFVIVIEDAHEATEAQLERWFVLARALPKGAGLLMTSRKALPEALRSDALEPLSQNETQGLLEANAGEPLPAAVLTWIFERSKGNPLFSLEFLRDLRRRGALAWRGADWFWQAPEREQLPNTIEAMIECVLDGISSVIATEALEGLAMLGPEDKDLWLVAAGTDEATFQRVKRDLEQLGIRQDDGFSHPLFREVALQRIQRDQRIRIAKRLFEHLEPFDPIRAMRFAKDAGITSERAFEVCARAIATETNDSLRTALMVQAAEFCPLEQRVDYALEAASKSIDFNLTETARLIEIVLMLGQPQSQVDTLIHAKHRPTRPAQTLHRPS
jgi:hypothetical protein